jgi:8-amino-7-oxononanoate synthase
MKARWKTHVTLTRLEAELDHLSFGNQLRRIERVPGVNLCSNDYLGLSDDPRLKLAIQTALNETNRVSSTGSRLLSGNDHAWETLEEKLASFVGAEAAVYFSSGYMANIGLFTSIVQPDATVFSDSANHASIIDGIRLSRCRKVIFTHSDLQSLERALRSSQSEGERFIVTESIFSMDGDRTNLDDLYTLADRYDAGVIIDEAHATGVAGPGGRGLVSSSGRPDCVLATLHTCGKALASMGAFVACSRTLRQYLINKARSFIFSTALPPYVAAQTSSAVTIALEANENRARLNQLSKYLRDELQARGFNTARSESQIVPVVLGSNEEALRVAKSLVDRGFAVKAIRPPTVPAGSARLRLSITAALGINEISHLIQALDDVR